MAERARDLNSMMARYTGGETVASKPVIRETAAPVNERRAKNRPWSGAGAGRAATAAVIKPIEPDKDPTDWQEF
jgi:hypothetical protein